VFLFSSKDSIFTDQAKQNTEDTFKNHVFFDSTNFLKAAKFDRSNIQKEKKNTHPDLTEVLGKNFEPDRSSRSGEKGKTYFVLVKTGF
jgi:hypothetical protein